MNLNGSVVGSATVSALFKCRTCHQDSVCEATIIVTGADVPQETTRVAGRIVIEMPCKGCSRTSALALDVPPQGDEEEDE